MRTWMILVAIGGIAGCGLIANIESVRYESDAGQPQEAGPGNEGDAGEDVKDAGARDATDWRKSTDFCGRFDAATTYFCSDFELGADVEDEGWARHAPNREDIAFAIPGHAQSGRTTWFHRGANTSAPVTMSWSTSIDQTGRSTFVDLSVILPPEVPDETVWAQLDPGSSSGGCPLQFMATGVRLTRTSGVLPFTQSLPRTEPAHLYVVLTSTGSGDDQLSVELKNPTTTTILDRQTIPCKNRGVSTMSFGVHGNDVHGANRSLSIDNVAIGVP